MSDLHASSLFDVSQKVVLVTGGSSGLGKSMAKAYVLNGARVYIASRKLSQLQAVANELNTLASSGPGATARGGAGGGGQGVCFPLVADLKDKAGVDDLIKKFREKGETKLDVLVNNTGMSWGAKLEDFPEKDGWDRLMATNVKSIFYMTAGLIPELSKDVSNTNPGRVINITSIAGSSPVAETPLNLPGSGTYSYAASKAAANHLTRVLATSLAKKNIMVNAIAPGVFPTNMTKTGVSNDQSLKMLLADQPTGRLGGEEDIAGVALFLSSRAAAHITGTIITVDGGNSLGGQEWRQQAAKSKL